MGESGDARLESGTFLGFCLPYSSAERLVQICPFESYPFSLPYIDLIVPEKNPSIHLFIYSFILHLLSHTMLSNLVKLLSGPSTQFSQLKEGERELTNTLNDFQAIILTYV